MTDTIHTTIALLALLAITGGIGVEMGYGWGAATLGTILLSGVIYARTRK